MFTKALVSTVRTASISRSGAVRLAHHAHYKPPHMNELPVPQGSWQEANKARQLKYNLHLAFGVGFLCFSLAVAKGSGLFFLNFSAPERPGPKTTYSA